jgi:hypothetical protein
MLIVERFAMRLFLRLAVALALLGTGWPVLAQEGGEGGSEGTVIDIGGGVYVPVPRDRRTTPELLDPGAEGQPSPRRRTEGGPETVYGRERGRTRLDEEGREVPVFQSSRISGVEHADTSGDRFHWFYVAEEVYNGIIPRIRDTLPHLSRYRERGAVTTQRNEITWIGFQPFGEFTRVFIQLARFPSYRVEEHEEGAVLAIVFDNTRISLSNFTRFIDTSHFGRSVQRIDAERLDGGRTRVLIWRDEQVTYTVSPEGDYLFIDFQDTGARRRSEP